MAIVSGTTGEHCSTALLCRAPYCSSKLRTFPGRLHAAHHTLCRQGYVRPGGPSRQQHIGTSSSCRSVSSRLSMSVWRIRRRSFRIHDRRVVCRCIHVNRVRHVLVHILARHGGRLRGSCDSPAAPPRSGFLAPSQPYVASRAVRRVLRSEPRGMGLGIRSRNWSPVDFGAPCTGAPCMGGAARAGGRFQTIPTRDGHIPPRRILT